MTDQLILELVMALDGGHFQVDSTTAGVEYFAADVLHENRQGAKRTYRIIWLLEGDICDVLGVVNAVWRRDRGVCTNCGTRRHLNFDHIRPLALGGSTTSDNLRLLCFQCNQRAGMRTFGVDKMRVSARGRRDEMGANRV